jgi:hypothetical protein
MQTFNIPATTLPDGPSQLPEQSIPQGTTGLDVTLDVSQMVAGQRLVISCDVVDAADVRVKHFDVDTYGPYIDKRNPGATVNTVTQTPGWVTPAAAGWKLRTLVQVTKGPLQISGGTIKTTP